MMQHAHGKHRIYTAVRVSAGWATATFLICPVSDQLTHLLQICSFIKTRKQTLLISAAPCHRECLEELCLHIQPSSSAPQIATRPSQQAHMCNCTVAPLWQLQLSHHDYHVQTF